MYQHFQHMMHLEVKPDTMPELSLIQLTWVSIKSLYIASSIQIAHSSICLGLFTNQNTLLICPSFPLFLSYVPFCKNPFPLLYLPICSVHICPLKLFYIPFSLLYPHILNICTHMRHNVASFDWYFVNIRNVNYFWIELIMLH